MTGITSAPWRDSLEFDRADVCYLKVKDSAEKFAVLQFGVCPFRWDSSKQSFIAHRHNFYIFTERLKNIFTEWRDGFLRNSNGELQFQGNSNDSQQQLRPIFFKMRPALSLSGFTSHKLRLIQLVIKRHFQDLAYVKINGEKTCQQHLVVRTDSKDDRELLMKVVKDKHCRQAEVKVQAAVGSQ